eukprot:1159353-Pelagomonas_calceolata.AAC.4
MHVHTAQPLLSHSRSPHCPAAAGPALPFPRYLLGPAEAFIYIYIVPSCAAVAGCAHLLHTLLHHPGMCFAPTLGTLFWASPCVKTCC